MVLSTTPTPCAEDKAGAEQVWIQAERNMDTSVKNDETHSVGGERSHYVKKNELHRIKETNQIQAVKGGTEILTGRIMDAAVEQYVYLWHETASWSRGKARLNLMPTTAKLT